MDRKSGFNHQEVIKNIGVESILASLLVFLLTVSATCVGGWRLYSSTKESIELKGRVNAVESAKELDNYILVRKSTVMLAAYVVDEMIRDGKDNQEILDYLTAQSTSIKKAIDEDYTGLYGWIKGEYCDGVGWVPDADYRPTERPWYQETMADKEVSFTVEQSPVSEDCARLRFTMADTGIGMDAAFLPKLFESFTQEDGSTTNEYGGSGLGMAITKNIVDMMGGEIEVQSEKGVGSTFVVTVPLKRAPGEQTLTAGEDAQPSEEPVSLVGRHILIAEDQEMNAEILSEILDLEDMTSEWAQNGRQAVELFEQSEAGHFDAILMDMRMPVMDGLAASRAIRGLSRPDAAKIPIIALTANAFVEDVNACLQAGMDAHLSKPVDIDLLKDTLVSILCAHS